MKVRIINNTGVNRRRSLQPIVYGFAPCWKRGVEDEFIRKRANLINLSAGLILFNIRGGKGEPESDSVIYFIREAFSRKRNPATLIHIPPLFLSAELEIDVKSA